MFLIFPRVFFCDSIHLGTTDMLRKNDKTMKHRQDTGLYKISLRWQGILKLRNQKKKQPSIECLGIFSYGLGKK